MGHVLDGCGEFCPSGPPETPEFFICAACHCHRNFHRKMKVKVEVEVEVEARLELPILPINHPSNDTPIVIIDDPEEERPRKPRKTLNKNKVVIIPPAPPAETTTEMGGGEIELADQSSLKRKYSSTSSSTSVRMRLDADQKEKVRAFAEKIGWRWTKYNEQVIPFCAEIGITPNFLKNWIDNNRPNHRSLSPAVYGECTRKLLASTTIYATDGCQAFVPDGPFGSIEALRCQICGCHRNFHRRLNVHNHQFPSAPSTPPTQQQVYNAASIVEAAGEGDVNMEESSKRSNAKSVSLKNTQMFKSPQISVELAETIMSRATRRWVHLNKNDDDEGCISGRINNKRKKSWDEYVAEEYEKGQPEILATQLESTSLNNKNKKIKVNENDEKKDKVEMYFKNKHEAFRKLCLARAGESSSSSSDYHD
ncbi:hypothetical protein HAX54_051406 [Datura stramonium]|uniref:ZF-HD dimerization-type domain-containing protein n=1 Tax=Datura stramonium TaxID=4076 RepID=A0ABS8WR86_DATST|nr:hypothetical protein [Datura stramonium]